MVTGEEENEEKDSYLSLRRRCLREIRGGLLVRVVGVALLLCFYSGNRDTCIYLLSLLRGCFHVVEIGRFPQKITSGVALP